MILKPVTNVTMTLIDVFRAALLPLRGVEWTYGKNKGPIHENEISLPCDTNTKPFDKVYKIQIQNIKFEINIYLFTGESCNLINYNTFKSGRAIDYPEWLIF